MAVFGWLKFVSLKGPDEDFPVVDEKPAIEDGAEQQ